MTLLEEYERKWADDDPMDPRYSDDGNRVCPNDGRFTNRFKQASELDQELRFDDD